MSYYILYVISFYRCSKCEQTFSMKSEYKLHIKEHTNDTFTTVDKGETVGNSEDKDTVNDCDVLSYCDNINNTNNNEQKGLIMSKNGRRQKYSSHKCVVVSNEICFEVISY